jgi:hypothetical protein
MPTIPPPTFVGNRTHVFVRVKSPDKWWCIHWHLVGFPAGPYFNAGNVAAFKARFSTPLLPVLAADAELFSLVIFTASPTDADWSVKNVSVASTGTGGSVSLPSLVGPHFDRRAGKFTPYVRAGRTLAGTPVGFAEGSRLTAAAKAAVATYAATTVGVFNPPGAILRFIYRDDRTLPPDQLGVFIVRDMLKVHHRRRDRGARGKWFPTYPDTP